MELSWSRYYLVVYSGGSSYGVASGCDNSVVVPRTPHLNSQNVYFCLDGGDFVSSCSSDYSSMSHSIKCSFYYSLPQRKDDRFISSGDCRGTVSPSKPISTTRNFIEVHKFMMGGNPYQHCRIESLVVSPWSRYCSVNATSGYSFGV